MKTIFQKSSKFDQLQTLSSKQLREVVGGKQQNNSGQGVLSLLGNVPCASAQSNNSQTIRSNGSNSSNSGVLSLLG